MATLAESFMADVADLSDDSEEEDERALQDEGQDTEVILVMFFAANFASMPMCPQCGD